MTARSAKLIRQRKIKMSSDKINVLLAAFNGESYIAQQLDSILAQEDVDIHILISDDGSTDDTRNIIEEYQQKYPEQIKVCDHIKEGKYAPSSVRMPASALNFFWLLARPSDGYVMLSDQDDVWKSDKAKVLLKRMKELEAKSKNGEEQPILIWSDCEVVDEDLGEISPSLIKYQHIDPKRKSLSEILIENPVTGGSVMMNQALAGYFKELPKTCVMHDWWIALTVSCFGTIDYVPKALYLYRQHIGNVMGSEKTGSLNDVTRRLTRQKEVADNYRNIFAQASAFRHFYGDRLSRSEEQTIRAFLALPNQSPAERTRNIRLNGFNKSSKTQTAALAFTIPKYTNKKNTNKKSRNNTDRTGTEQAETEHVETKQAEAVRPGKSTAITRVWCVILNYNDADSTIRLVNDIIDYGCLKGVIVVDNDSTDDSLERLKWLKGIYEDKLYVLEAGTNAGYGAGNNFGTRYAIRQKNATHVIIANPDVSFSEECVRQMTDTFLEHSEVGVVSVKMDDGKTGGKIRKKGQRPQNAWPLRSFTKELLSMGPISRRVFASAINYPGSYFAGKEEAYVDVVHGSLLMVDAGAFEISGGYDESIFLYQEEAVLGMRMKQAGYRTVLLLNETYEHEDSVSTGKAYEKLSDRQKIRNQSELYYMKTYLNINKLQEAVAKMWFKWILIEDRIAEI